jgi:hypothetical protein
VSRHAPLIKELAGRLRDLDISSIVYFHTDHFEPWRAVGSGPAVGPSIVESIHDFCRATERMDFARRLTLFYKPHLNYVLRKGDEFVRAHPDDLVGFSPRTEYEERSGREAMQEVVVSSAHDIQLHIHHEYYTATTAHTDPVAVQWFSSPLGRSLDGPRLELAIKLNREIIAREAGRSSARWFFIHGHWALNGSDKTSCTISNEIELLLRHGCCGDFTFPAGRQHTNPRIKVPYLCTPVDEPKGYDLPEAQPEVACGNAAAAHDKFFIWASSATSVQCSLDYMSETTRRHLDNTEKAAKDLIENAYVADGRLYIKTHAHSLHPYYFEHARAAVFPHQYPATQVLLSVLLEAAAQAGRNIEFCTAPEVYDLLLSAPTKPDVDLAGLYLRSKPRRGMGIFSALRPSKAAAGADVAVTERPRLPRDRAIELVNDVTVTTLSKRIEILGVYGSGAYEHYNKMLQQGSLVSPSDVAALTMIDRLREIADFEACHEIGSGLGTLPFLLALEGCKSVGIEADHRRHETAQAIWRDLQVLAGLDAQACRLICRRFPALPFQIDTSRSLAVVTDFVTTQTPQREQAIFSGLRRYPYLVVDLRRFCVVRDTTEEQQALLERFLAHGFEKLGGGLSAVDTALVLLENRKVVPRLGKPFWRRLSSL